MKDEGRGIDVEEAKKRGGLGLVNMQERVHLAHGSLCVESEPGTGTSVLAVVPLANETPQFSQDRAVEQVAGITGMV